MSTVVSFDSSVEDASLIDKIVDRVAEVSKCGISASDTTMDLLCVHNSYPLDLKGLLESRDFDLLHDVFGIAKHLNRETGELMNCFLPRYHRTPEA